MFNDCLYSQLRELFPGKCRSRSLESFEPSDMTPFIAPDGSKFYTDISGDIMYAEYASGAIVSMQHSIVTARTACGDHWVVSSGGLSFRVD
jgi:hypothetical protein